MDIFDKAKELGQAIIDSKEFVRFKKAEEVQMNDDMAQMLISAYNSKRREASEKMREGNLSKEEQKLIIDQLNDEFEMLSKNKVIAEYINSSKDFEDFHKKVTDIINFFVTGEQDSSCGGKCSSCEGCH